MRISAWSSVVCSSDLALHPSAPPSGSRRRGQARCPMTCRPAATRAGRHVTLARRTGRRPSRERTSARTRSEERRVGKSVSVRVDLGGRRIIKKKKKRNNTKQSTYKHNRITKYHDHTST